MQNMYSSYTQVPKNMRNPDLGQISICGFLQDLYHNLLFGLDLDRFCAPDRIIEL